MTAKNNSKDRETCWKARDFYFSCLAASFSPQDLYNSLKDGGTVSESDIIPKGLRSEECNKLKAEMYEKCPKSWAEHFEKKFRGDKLKEYQLEKLKEIGAQPL